MIRPRRGFLLKQSRGGLRRKQAKIIQILTGKRCWGTEFASNRPSNGHIGRYRSCIGAAQVSRECAGDRSLTTAV